MTLRGLVLPVGGIKVRRSSHDTLPPSLLLHLNPPPSSLLPFLRRSSSPPIEAASGTSVSPRAMPRTWLTSLLLSATT